MSTFLNHSLIQYIDATLDTLYVDITYVTNILKNLEKINKKYSKYCCTEALNYRQCIEGLLIKYQTLKYEIECNIQYEEILEDFRSDYYIDILQA